MRRILSLTAATALLAVSLAACSTPANDAAGTNSPSPAVSVGPPDEESCDQANALALLAGLRMAGVAIALEMKTQEDAAEQMADVVEQVAQAEAKVTHPEVKVVVAEYKTVIVDLKKQLETAGADKSKLSDEIDAALTKFEKSEEKLGKVCVESSAEPTTAAKAGLEADCDKIQKATIALAEPMLSIAMIENDAAKLADAVKKLTAAINTYIAELGKIAAEAKDAEFKAAITAAATDMQAQAKKIPAVAKDSGKLGDLLTSDSFSAAQEKMTAFCGK